MKKEKEVIEMVDKKTIGVHCEECGRMVTEGMIVDGRIVCSISGRMLVGGRLVCSSCYHQLLGRD